MSRISLQELQNKLAIYIERRKVNLIFPLPPDMKGKNGVDGHFPDPNKFEKYLSLLYKNEG